MKFLTVDFLNKVLMVAAVSFSGFYRVMLIILTGWIFDGQTVSSTAETYLLFTLATSLFGLPLASVFMGKGNEENYAMFLLVILLSLVFALTCQKFYPAINPFGLFFCCLASSFFEVVRQSVLNKKLYAQIVVCYLLAFLFFVFSFFVNIDQYEYFTLAFSLVSFYLLMIYICNGGAIKLSVASFFFKPYFNFLVSSAFSTAVNYVVPLVLIYFLTKENSYYVTILSSVLSIFIFIPRLLLNGYYYDVRGGGETKCSFNVYRDRVNLYIVTVSLIVLPVVFSSFIFGAVMVVYAAAILFSQSSLIYSIFFTVNGNEIILRNVNVFCFFVFLLFSFILYCFNFVLIFNDYEFIFGFVLLFFLYQLLKVLMSKLYFSKARLC